jgi:hypothetical protein
MGPGYGGYMMITVLQLLLGLLLLTSIGVLAMLVGVDTRDGRDWQPRSEWDAPGHHG